MEDYFDGPEWNLRRLKMERMANIPHLLPDIPIPIGRNDPSASKRKSFYLQGLSDPMFNPNKYNIIGYTALIDAITSDMGVDLVISILKCDKTDVNICSDPENLSPLMWASVSENPSYLDVLCKVGAYSQDSGEAPLNHATPKVMTLANVEGDEFDIFENLKGTTSLTEEQKNERARILLSIAGPDDIALFKKRHNKDA